MIPDHPIHLHCFSAYEVSLKKKKKDLAEIVHIIMTTSTSHVNILIRFHYTVQREHHIVGVHCIPLAPGPFQLPCWNPGGGCPWFGGPGGCPCPGGPPCPMGGPGIRGPGPGGGIPGGGILGLIP